jgi:hypothetical protein
MSAKDKNDWTHKANESYKRTNFPNCIGAVDGKHIRIRKPYESGSQFFNDKNFFQRPSWLWQMQTVVSCQQKLKSMVCRVILTCLKLDTLKITGGQ